MAKEFEKSDFPTVQMCNIIPIAKTVGSNRIVPTVSIPYPLGKPGLSEIEQYKIRYAKVDKALNSLTAEITEQCVFD